MENRGEGRRQEIALLLEFSNNEEGEDKTIGRKREMNEFTDEGRKERVLLSRRFSPTYTHHDAGARVCAYMYIYILLRYS